MDQIFLNITAVGLLLIAANNEFTVRETVVHAAWVSAVAGGVAAIRNMNPTDEHKWFKVFKYSTNCMVLGACIAMMLSAHQVFSAWQVIGICGGVTFGGMTSVNWFLKFFRTWFQRRFDEV